MEVEETSPALVLLGLADLPQVAAIERLVFAEPLSLAEITRLWHRKETVYVGFRVGDVVAAYFGFTVSGPTAHVIANATHPDFRGRGYGHRVLREAEPIACARGARWYLGEVRRSNTVQRHILHELGWAEVGICPRFFGNGEDAYVVWHLLACEDPKQDSRPHS